MKNIKCTFYGQRHLLFLTLVIAVTPSAAHAHGLEQFTPYVALSALIIGLITGAICALRHISVGNAVLPSLGVYLITLALSSLFLPGEISWSDIHIVIILTLFLGIVVGLLPLVLGIAGMSLVLNFIIKICEKNPKQPGRSERNLAGRDEIGK